MKLELKHLAPYLPYGLKIWHENTIYILRTISDDNYRPYHIAAYNRSGADNEYWLKDIKSILHPLSDLTKEIEHNGEKFVPIEKWDDIYGVNDDFLMEVIINLPDIDVLNYPYYLVNQLFEWHFDVFGLIPEGLAVNINTLK